MTLAERLEHLHASIQVKLAQQGMPTDRETLEEVCTAIACLVRDPNSIALHASSMSAEDYTAVADCLTLAARDFAAEIAALQALVSSVETHMQEEVQAWAASAPVSPTAALDAIREMILTRFVDPNRNPAGYRPSGNASDVSDKRVD
jgi:hypothetical protein